jgi:hypothetical protein
MKMKTKKAKMRNDWDGEDVEQAIMRGEAELAKKLIKEGHRIDLSGPVGWYFELIAYCPDIELAELILQTHPDYDPVYLLNEAYSMDDEKFAIWLIKKGININKAHGKRNILSFCAVSDNTNMISMAFSAGLEYNPEDYSPWFKAGIFEHAKALHSIMSYVFPGEAGRLGIQGLKALEQDDLFELDKTLKKLKTVDLHRNIITALYSSAMTAHNTALKCSELLANYGANINVQDEYGMSVVSYKTEIYMDGVSKVMETLDLFAKLGGSFEIRNKNGNTIIENCIYSGKYKTVEKLLQLGADINSFDRHSYLCWLSSQWDEDEKIDLLKILSRVGYDLKSSYEGNDPLNFAKGKTKKYLKRLIK